MTRLTYWTRHWIIQEILLSTCPILVYGSNAVKFSLLLDLCPDGDVYRGIAKVSAMVDILDAAGVFRSDDQDPLSTWFFVGYVVNKSLCTDLRDKVYGIQSLYPEELRMQVDYQKSDAIVYLEMVSIWFNHFRTRVEATSEFKNGCGLLARGMNLSYDTLQMGLQQLQSEKHYNFDTEANVQELDNFLQRYVYNYFDV
jgi:hypothetical protein